MVVLVAVVAAIAFYFDKKRREMWESVARRYGFTYQRHDPHDIPTRYASFALFQRGHSRKASNCLEGKHQDTPVLLFDYRYTTGSGKNQTTHRLSALIARVDLNCQYLLIRPESFFDKVGDFLGFGDIDFEFEEFNRRFHVKGPDKKFAYDICHSGMMDYLIQHDRLTWELSGNCLILYGLGTFDLSEIDYCLAAVNGFLAQTPQYLRKG
jgi:hypothetical protein